jgi:hypothetical protein
MTAPATTTTAPTPAAPTPLATVAPQRPVGDLLDAVLPPLPVVEDLPGVPLVDTVGQALAGLSQPDR